MAANSNAEYNVTQELQAAYDVWRASHPNALDVFQDLMKFSRGREIVVFLDYDGTLSEIVSNPDEAFMTNEMRAALDAVASNFPTAILSGRSIRKVYEFVNLNNIYYSGNHGNTIMPPAESFFFLLQIFDLLTERTCMIRGASVENNKCCVSVHIRNLVDKADAPLVDEIVRRELKKYPDFRIMLGHEVMEVRPNNNLNKGTALEQVMKSMGYTSSENVVPLFIGDDKTDEDGFRVLRRLGSELSIVVSSMPKETEANYSLRDPKEVMELLLRLVEWKKML
ncbi:hypothetical protein QQ045_028674 [Rhodiola kirilowii]